MKALNILRLFVVCAGCSTNTSKSNLSTQQKEKSYFNIYAANTLKNLIDRDISEFERLSYHQDVILKDTTFKSEDESSWNGIVFYKEAQILFFVETSWENENLVKRITVLSSTIAGLNDTKIGSRFKDIKSNLSQIIPSYPDGYFGLKDKNNKHITYFFDIGKNSNLSIGNVKFETIPDNLTVSQILIE